MRASVRLIISALALVGTGTALVAQTPPGPIVKVEGLRQISLQPGGSRVRWK